MLFEQPPQLPFTDTKAFSECVDRFAVQRTFRNQREGARDGVGRAAPGCEVRRTFRAATQTRTIARFLRGTGGWVERYVCTLGGSRRTDRAAVDSRGAHGSKQAPVETGVAGRQSAVAGVIVE